MSIPEYHLPWYLIIFQRPVHAPDVSHGTHAPAVQHQLPPVHLLRVWLAGRVLRWLVRGLSTVPAQVRDVGRGAAAVQRAVCQGQHWQGPGPGQPVWDYQVSFTMHNGGSRGKFPGVVISWFYENYGVEKISIQIDVGSGSLSNLTYLGVEAQSESVT